MPSNKIDFSALNSKLLSAVDHHLGLWLPNGELKGHEYQVGSLSGERGSSLKINTRTGKWKDFATNDSGGDLVSLFAAIKNLTQIDAAKELEGFVPKNMTPVPRKPPSAPYKIVKPPLGTKMPDCVHYKHGKPSARYVYRDEEKRVLFIIARYDHDSGKDCIPYCYTSDKKWVNKMWPGKRPLFGLTERIHEAKGILIVEGEKAVLAARKIVGTGGAYAVVTWSGGSNAYDKTDWTPLYGKKILIWPDADSAGKKAAEDISRILVDHTEEVKVINLGEKNGGWDAADALDEGMGWSGFCSWAKPRVKVIEPKPQRVEEPPPPTIAHHIPADITNNLNLYNDAESAIQVAPEIKALWSKARLACSGTGNPIISAENVIRLLKYTGVLDNHLWYDEFYVDIFTDFGGIVHPWSDRDMIDLLVKFQGKYGMHRLTMQVLEVAVRQYAYTHARNAAMDWIDGLKWDGESRIESFFSKYLGSNDDEYTRCASKNWWISMAARIKAPGCQVDNMIILEGIQGARKSTLLKVIGGDWYTEASAAFGTKDFYQQLQGKLVVEIAELDMFSKSDVNTIKRVVTNTVDEFRPPYSKRPAKFPRHCVFVGTTNQEGYLMDDTGNRRYWPIAVRHIDIESVERDKDQLFAEAVYLFKAGESWWNMPDKETKNMQAERMAEDPWLEPISTYISDITIRINGVTATGIATNCLKIEMGRVSRRETLRISKCLRQLGWVSRVVRDGDIIKKKFMQPDHERLQMPQPEVKDKEIINYAPGAVNRPQGV